MALRLAVLSLALWLCPRLALGVPEPIRGRVSFEGRGGALVPAQVLDGAGLRLALGWQLQWTGPLRLGVEVGANRITLTALTADVASGGGSPTFRADHRQWFFPLLAGLGGAILEHDRTTWTLWIAGGGAYRAATLEKSVVGGPALESQRSTSLELVAQARLEAAWRVADASRLLLSAGWLQALPSSRREIQPTGLFLEMGWRVEL